MSRRKTTASVAPGLQDDTKLKALGIDVDRSSPHRDLFSGSAESLIAGGILSPDRVPQGGGRSGWRAAFMPDGTPRPKGLPTLWALPGFMTVTRFKSGVLEVGIAVAAEEEQRRHEANRADWIAGSIAWRQREGAQQCEREDGSELFIGLREQLLELGVPARWMDGLPKPGKVFGGHTLREGGRKVEVCVNKLGEFQINVRPATTTLPTSPYGVVGRRQETVDGSLPSNVIPFPITRKLVLVASHGGGR